MTRTLTTLALIFLVSLAAQAQARRVVIIKVDGLPSEIVERYVRERNPRTGKSELPWFEHVFYERGTRLQNFYVRGMSLSGPSWSLLDTGQHLQVRGNVEFDRYTLHTYDYLNFIPLYIANVAQRRVDMPGVEVLDELGIPLLMDAFPHGERYISFQLYQRGVRWTTLSRGLQNRFTTRSPRELVDEWTMGIEARAIIMDQLERELIEKLNDPKIRYLDYYTSEFDHAAHHNNDAATHLIALKELDALIGRVWTAIQKTPQASETALIVVSDHGVNSKGGVYSQGFNLVKLLGSRAGGGHHVVTKRRLLLDYSLKGIYPLVPLITTTTDDTYYLKGQSTLYPTALLDFDGNERAAFHLRDSDLNVLHILWQQLERKDISEPLRRALTDAFFETIDGRRDEWNEMLAQLNEEIAALTRLLEKQRAQLDALPKKWTKEDVSAGRDKEAQRLFARWDSGSGDVREYTDYARTLTNLLALKRESFAPSKLKIEDFIARGAMGEPNNIYKLQNYTVGPAAGGFVLKRDGSLDMERSFTRVDYFQLLNETTVRNNVQATVDNHPIDFVAVRIPREELASELERELMPTTDAVWLYGGPERQALILSREDEAGRLRLRYLPIENLRQDEKGRIRFTRASLRAHLPLKIFEDERLAVPANSRAGWLDEWHTDEEWLRAVHKTTYSNAIIGLHEQLARYVPESLQTDAPGLSVDERLIRRFRQRQRRLSETDVLVMANNHWNFDVRGFNPGGNHGSFFRVSTHSTLMLAGGERTGIPRREVIEEPYDSLSFVPTVMALTGQLRDERVPVPVLWHRGFRSFPGRIIEGVLSGAGKDRGGASPVAAGAPTKP
ncbi:MAG: alkaline phosphatase family protein [Pyrinomonadaceae bacterium]|nr:alkaline phosphatase family protein [Pyrinomonadaceae bacterium]